MIDYAQWFASTGKCPCGKDATGELMSLRNDRLGPYCRPCAQKRIRAAQADRASLSLQPEN